MSILVEGGGVVEGGTVSAPKVTAQRISEEKELIRVVDELKKFSPLNDYPKNSNAYNRILILRKRQTELREKLGVVA